MNPVLLAAGSVVILLGLVLLGSVAVVAVRRSRYDIDAATAAHQARKKACEPLTILQDAPEEAVS